LREQFGRHGGHEIDTAGDGFFVACERAGDAVVAGSSHQRMRTPHSETGADTSRT